MLNFGWRYSSTLLDSISRRVREAVQTTQTRSFEKPLAKLLKCHNFCFPPVNYHALFSSDFELHSSYKTSRYLRIPLNMASEGNGRHFGLKVCPQLQST